MATINYQITITPDSSSTNSDCVIYWIGLNVYRNCEGQSTFQVYNWHKGCTVINPTDNSTWTVQGSFDLTDEEADQCRYSLTLCAISCCSLNITDCNDPNIPGTPPLGNPSLKQTTYTIDTSYEYSTCKRYVIGYNGGQGTYGGGIISNIKIIYTPCNPNSSVICDPTSWQQTQQTFTFQQEIWLDYLDNNMNIDDITADKQYIEFCSSTYPIVTDTAGNPINNIFILESGNHSTLKCCHNCKANTVWNNSNDGTEGIVFYQDCNDGLIKSETISPGSDPKQYCSESLHVTSNNDVTIAYVDIPDPGGPVVTTIYITPYKSC
jgi:hypothetical protein